VTEKFIPKDQWLTGNRVSTTKAHLSCGLLHNGFEVIFLYLSGLVQGSE
jgi:hypothetical protein